MAINPIAKEMFAKRVGLSEDTLLLIGYGALLWNSLETQLQVLIGSIGGWKRSTSEFITVDLQNLSRIQLARNLLHISRLHPSVIDHCKAVLDLFDELRAARNAIIHGIPAFKPGEVRPHLTVRFEAKKGDGNIKAKELCLTEGYMSDFVRVAHLLSTALTHTRTLIRRDRIFRRSSKFRARQSHSDFVWQGAGRGPEAPDLIGALELLRPRLHSTKELRRNR